MVVRTGSRLVSLAVPEPASLAVPERVSLAVPEPASLAVPERVSLAVPERVSLARHAPSLPHLRAPAHCHSVRAHAHNSRSGVPHAIATAHFGVAARRAVRVPGHRAHFPGRIA